MAAPGMHVLNGLEGRRALVTGAGSGIGLGTARLLAALGAQVLLTGRRREPLAEAVTQLGERTSYEVADIAMLEDVRRVLSVAKSRLGGLDILVCNASIEGANGRVIPDYPLESFDEVMAINVRGTFMCLQHGIALMRESGGGSIVIVSSIGGTKARGYGNSGYIASKHAQIGMMRSASVECAPWNIRVNAVAPGPTDTRMMRSIETQRSPDAPDEARKAIVAGLPTRRYSSPDEVAQLIGFLVSDAASGCTGGVYTVDSGLSAV